MSQPVQVYYEYIKSQLNKLAPDILSIEQSDVNYHLTLTAKSEKSQAVEDMRLYYILVYGGDPTYLYCGFGNGVHDDVEVFERSITDEDFEQEVVNMIYALRKHVYNRIYGGLNNA